MEGEKQFDGAGIGFAGRSGMSALNALKIAFTSLWLLGGALYSQSKGSFVMSHEIFLVTGSKFCCEDAYCLSKLSFGVSPAVCAFALGLRTPVDTLLLSFFVLCGLTRLARFNVTVAAVPKDASGKSKYFEGTPIPTSLGIVGAMALCVWMGKVEGGSQGVVGGLWAEGGLVEVHPIVGVFVGWGCAMVSKSIHIPKP